MKNTFKYVIILICYMLLNIIICFLANLFCYILNINESLNDNISKIISYIIIFWITIIAFKKNKINTHIIFKKLDYKFLIAIVFFFLSAPIIYQNILVWFASLTKLSPNFIEKICENDSLNNISILELSLSIISVGILVPIVEELFFRVFTIDYFRMQFKIPVVIIISSIVFTIVHFPKLQSGIEIFLMAVLMGIIYVKTNNVVYAVIAHVTHNVGYYVVGYLVGHNVKILNNNIVMEYENNDIFSMPLFIISLFLMIASFIYILKALKYKKGFKI